MTSPSDPGPEVLDRRATIVGTGLIGCSIGLALRQRDWRVTGTDVDESRVRRALELGAIDEVGSDPDAELTFVCTPVSSVAEAARAACGRGGVVTDVGGVKAPVVAAVDHRRFVGGHPMAGSEQEGADGARRDLFEGTTWVLTPVATTDDDAFALVRSVVATLGADVLSLAPERHDELVAQVSHVPHLTAAALMTLAADRAREHSALLRLAAGGFRDMTRIAAGHPAIWPDICVENRDAIAIGLDRLMETLGHVRDLVLAEDRSGLLSALEEARVARSSLPTRLARPEELVEMRMSVPDRPGVLSDITHALGENDVNIEDLEIAHSVEGGRGVLVIVVAAASSPLAGEVLADLGYHPSARSLA